MQLIHYFRRLWLGQFPLQRALWTDMLAIGTVVNLVTFLAAMAFFATGLPTWIGILLYVAHIPYNILVFTGVWRSAARESADARWLARAIAIVWVVVGFLI
jgi:hypothetical protein